MKKSGYGKLSIIFILIATLVCCAAMAIFGLSKNETGANGLSAEISAPDRDASSAIRGEESSDGTIPDPDVSAQATATYTGLSISNWNAAIASSGNTITVDGGTWSSIIPAVPKGITLNLVIPEGVTLRDVKGSNYYTFIVEGTLNVTGGGTLDGYGTTAAAFNVYYGGTLNFNGPTITNYKQGVYVGGGPNGPGIATFTMNGGTISGNAAGNTAAGGGVRVNAGAFIMNGGTISGNSAVGAGGVYVGSYGSFTMTGGEIKGNTATSNAAGVYNAGKFDMSGGTISGNTSLSGAGVNSLGTFTMSGGTISGNRAQTSGSGPSSGSTAGTSGGGVYVSGGTFTMTDGTISGNESGSGCGVYVSGGTFTMAGGEISNHTASGNGGGVYVGGGTFEMSAGSISKNSAKNGGGIAALSNGILKLTGGTVGSSDKEKGNTATEYGGGVYIQTPNVTTKHVISTDVQANKAKTGGGVYLSGGLVEFSAGRIMGNTATADGGGVYIQTGSFTQSGGFILNNPASGNGGGVYLNSGTYDLIRGYIGGYTDVHLNRAKLGGGVYLNGGSFNQSGGYISYNEANTSGGGVYLNAGTFTMTGGEISNNDAPEYGGGVCVGCDSADESGTFIMSAGSIYKNSSERGGGVAAINYGVLNLTGGIIGNADKAYGNTVTTAGGGVYISTTGTGREHILSTTIQGNTSSNNAGGVCINNLRNGDTVKMTGGAISDNTTAKVGGGVYAAGGVFIMSGGTISGNTTSTTAETGQGGGICQTATGRVTMTGGTISKNTAYYGGGVFVNAGTFTMEGGTVGGINNGNTSTYTGGGFYVNPGAKLLKTGGTISYNEAITNGGGICVFGGTVEITTNDENYIEYNKAVHGGGIFSASTATVTISAGYVRYNEATNNGGGIYVYGGSFDMSGGEISGNTASSYGGGVYFSPSTTGTITDGTISGNTAVNGGGVCVNGGVVTMEGGLVSENTATLGGGVNVNSGVFTMSGGLISGNKAENSSGTTTFGGGVYVGVNGTFILTDGTIAHNEANGGGGISIHTNGTVKMDGGTVSENKASGGGAVHTKGKFTLNGGSISGNTSKNDGGAVCAPEGTFTMTGGTISGNTSGTRGGGVHVDGSCTFSMTGGSISGNSAPVGGGVDVAGGTFKLGGLVYIYGNTYSSTANTANNVYAAKQGAITFSSKLSANSKIGIVAGNNFTVTSGFTTAGHTAADMQAYFVADLRGLVLLYKDGEVTTNYDLLNAWNLTVQTSINGKTTEGFILFMDWTSTNGEFGTGVGFSDDGTILVPEGCSIALCLNGFTIARNGETGSVIRVVGALTIDDTSGGAISGAKAETGAIYVAGGSLTLNGGTICDNESGYGGGVYVDENGTFTMAGGAIVRNTAERGAGVYVKNGTFTMAGGVIGGSAENANTASSYGGGVYIDGGTFAMTDGVISYNVALRGAGVYVNGGKFTLASDGSIEYNAASAYGGGIYVNGGNLEITGGAVTANTAANGAGVYVAGGTVVMNGGEIYSNSASENGAGIYAAGGRVTVEDGEIYENIADGNGGGIYVAGATSQFTLSGGNVTNNTAENGVGVYVANGTFTLTGSGEITANKDGTNGAGIYLENGALNVTGGLITENTADQGAGIYVEAGTLTMSGGEISGNTASTNGGGVYTARSEDAVFTMSDGKITGNEATTNGGGVYAGTTSKFTLSGGEISENTAPYGGGVFSTSTFTMDGGAISNNTSTSTGAGGGVCVRAGTFTMSDGEISGNTAPHGGGVYNMELGTFIMTGGAIFDNTTTGFGGGVYSVDKFTMSGGEISGNTALHGGGVYNASTFTMSGNAVISENTATRYGGGVYVKPNGEFTLESGTISANTSSYGGGIFVDGGTLTMTGGTIGGDNESAGNKAIRNGGGLYVESGDVTVTGGAISYNKALNEDPAGTNWGYGGGIACMGSLTISSDTVSINNNSARMGGGISVYTATQGISATFTLNAGTIKDNSAENGGGVYMFQNGGAMLFEMNGGEISGNSVPVTGGGVYVGGGTFTMNGGTISGNSAFHGGGAFVKPNGTFTMTKGVISGNTADTASGNGGGVYVDGSTDTATAEITGGSVSENEAVLGGGVFLSGNFASLLLGGSASVAQNTASNNGGGICVLNGADAVISDNASVAYNTATNNGGGVNVNGAGSTLTLSGNGAITNNNANYGGAVYVTAGGAFTMENGSLSHNKARNHGGAVYVTGSTFTFNGGEISANTAANNGGGVYVAAGATSSFVMAGGTIGGEDETSANSATLGGGVYVAGGKVTFTSGTICGNTATGNGAGVYLSSGTFEISGNPAIYGNTMRDTDSNLYLYNNKTITVTGELTEGAQIGITGTEQITNGYYTVGGNGEDQKGYFFSDITGTIVTIIGNEIYFTVSLESIWNAAVQESFDNNGKPVEFLLVESWTAEDGSFGEGIGFKNGALYLPEGTYIVLNLNGYSINRDLATVTAEGSVFYVKGTLEISGTAGYVRGGASEQGGGVHVEEGGMFILSVGYIQNNQADLGGGVYVESGAEFNMNGGTIRSNTADQGAGVYVAGGTFNMAGGTIGGSSANANTASTNGGGVYVDFEGTFNMTDGAIRDNAAASNSAGVAVKGTFNMSGGSITGGTLSNDATSGGGVGVYYGTFTMDGGTISGNTSGNGGVYVGLNGTFTMNGGEISGNTATNYGGGVHVNVGTFEMTGGTISDNTATTKGGGVYIESGTFEMTDGTISNNTSSYAGGIFVTGNGTFEMTGGEISGNTAIRNGGGMYVDLNSSATITGGTISYNKALNEDPSGTVWGQGGGIACIGSLTINSDTVSINNNIANKRGGGVAIYVAGEATSATFTLNAGTIKDNSAENGGGVYISGSGATFEMKDGTVSGNTAVNGGGVCVATDGMFEMNGGTISGNAATNDGSATTYGGGVYIGVNGAFTLNDGIITANEGNGGGGIGSNGTFEMNGGTIANNTASGGAGVYTRSTFTLNGGKISDNNARGDGGGVCFVVGTFTMNGGTISGNTSATRGGGVHASSGTFKLKGGVITANDAPLGGGVHVAYECSMELSGSPMVYGNTSDGVESNVYLSNKLIVVTGMLSVNGIAAMIGVSMYDPKRFTQGFYEKNTAYNPTLLPSTVFFSDDSDYMVAADSDNEAILKANDYSRTTLSWQLSKDGGETWINVETPYFALRYKAGESYAVRALDGNGNPVDFTWATDSENGEIDEASFSGIGSYKFVINSDKYTNPALTFEVLPAQLIWQYSTDEGGTWFDFTADSIVYTGETYQVRAIVYYDPENPVELVSNDAMHDVGNYEYKVKNGATYENSTFNFEITTRYVNIEWNFGDALGNTAGGYYWNYDGLTHTPVAVLGGVSGKLAGTTLTYDYSWSGDTNHTFTSALSYAGEYTLSVALNDPNVVLSNTSVSYKINGVTLSLIWTDKDGNEGDEFTFVYDGEKHGLNVILDGVVAGETVEPYITYATRAGKELSGAPTEVGYYTATVKLPAKYFNYALDKVYTCQIVITQKTVKVEWIGNGDGYNWTFNGKANAPVASIKNPFTDEALGVPYTTEYAPVASNGDVGIYTTVQPVSAGSYIVRVTLNNTEGNYALDEATATQLFTIEKRGVNVTWTGKNHLDDEDTGAYFWYYDGEEHGVEAKIDLSGLFIYKDGAYISSLEINRTDGQLMLTTASSATAAVALADTAFNANFYIANGGELVYEVRKAVIGSVVWTDAFKNEYKTGDTPEFDFGTVSGVTGPGFTALADGKCELLVSYSKTYPGDWVVDVDYGYTAYARLSAEDALNYEFAGGAEYASITFFIKSVGGFKQDIKVTWVVFVNENEYVSLEEYLSGDGFVYNGKVQYPTPIYLKDNGVDYEILDLNMNSVGADAGEYTARLKPSTVYNIKESDFTLDYVIKKLDIVIGWQDGQYDGNDTFNYVYNGSEQAPYAYADGNYGLDIEITVKGKTNAGTYLAIADAGNNFNITEGRTQVYTISKLGLEAGLVVWDYTGASGDKDNGWYWVYDHKEHAPKATVLTEQGILELVVTGKTSEIGTHVAHAYLNSSIAEHNNYYLIGTASTSFEIVQVKVGQVYWVDEDGNAGLEFTYDGKAHAPKAYFYAEEGAEPTYLNVTVVGGSAVEAGSYTAYVSSELGFTVRPTCNFTIKAMELEAEWSDTTLPFNGEWQSPTLTLSEGADGKVLEEGVDYVVTSFMKAGTYTVQVKFINTNYTVAEEDSTCEFVIGKITLTGDDFEWSKDGYDEDKGGYVWLFDENNHAPQLTISYTLGDVEVVFEVGYTGVTSTVGTHKVTAYIKSATMTVDGEETDVTDSFAFSAEMEYEIVASVVTIDWDWTGAKYDEERDAYYWTFDGEYHAPKAYLADENGERIKDEHGNDVEIKDVYGAEKNARDAAYTATAVVPAEYNFTGNATVQYYIDKATIEVNWDFGEASYDEEKGVYVWTYGDEVEPKAYIRLENGDNGAPLDVTGFETDAGTHTLTVMQSNGNYAFASADEATQTYVINPMTVYVIWYGVGGYDGQDTENFKWTYGDENAAPAAYLAYMDTNGDLQLLLDKGNPIPVEVSGCVEEVGDHIAQAVDTFVNYEFAEEAFTQPYTISAKDLADSNFGWTADGAKEVDGLTFTYEYSGDKIMPVPSAEVEGLVFNTTIVKVNENGKEEPVLVITERGTYKVTAISGDSNYAVPEELATVLVIVTAKTVEATWDKTPLVYNGDSQKPKAYYQDVNGEWFELEVTVVGGSAVNAGETYTATASQPADTNYVLDESTAEKLFEIEQKVLPVEWVWESVTYDGNEHAPVPVVTSTQTDGISVVYEITLNGETAAEDGGKVVNAGSYVIKVWLDGDAKGNFKLDVDEYNFTINKRSLEITANDKEAAYGDSLTLTVDDVVFTDNAESGLVAADVEGVMQYLKDNLNNWLACRYTNHSAPGEYTIYVDALWLNEHLTNYEVTGKNGTLTVIPAEGKLVWQADGVDGEGTPVFVYDGKENLPKAYYYDAGTKSYVYLDVKLAEYDEESGYTVIDGKPVNAGTYYAVIVDGNGNVITEHGSYTFDNFGVKFEIAKRDVVIGVNGLTFTYGKVTEENLAELLGLDNGWYFGEVKPVDGDDLGITLTIEESCENGFLNVGTYTVKISWNKAEFGGNYTLNDDVEITLTVENAEVTVDLDKEGSYYLNDYVILTNGHECDFLDNPEKFIEIAGYQDAKVSIRFSEAFVKGSEPSAEGYEYTNDKPANVTEAGYYVFNFKITVGNHNTLYGQLLVRAVEKENVLYVTVIKDLNEKYGFEVTENLAERLFKEDGCAHYDADISPVDEDDFLKWVTATVVGEDGNEVGGKLAVGTYKVIFGLSSEAPSKYSIHVNDSNHVYIHITKFVIDIDWGDESNLRYTYDGEIHMPVITVAGTVLSEDNKVGDGVYVITVNGEEVKVTLTVDGDFTTAGGHSVLVTVESENFELDEDNLRSVSITVPDKEQPVEIVGGLSGWQLWVLIAAAVVAALLIVVLIIALAKRKSASDDDGFYDPIDE